MPPAATAAKSWHSILTHTLNSWPPRRASVGSSVRARARSCFFLGICRALSAGNPHHCPGRRSVLLPRGALGARQLKRQAPGTYVHASIRDALRSVTPPCPARHAVATSDSRRFHRHSSCLPIHAKTEAGGRRGATPRAGWLCSSHLPPWVASPWRVEARGFSPFLTIFLSSRATLGKSWSMAPRTTEHILGHASGMEARDVYANLLCLCRKRGGRAGVRE